MREYLRVTPTSEGLDPEGIPRVLESLHKLTTAESTGLAQKLNPLHSKTPLRFEFLALSEGADDPVEFFYGADEHLDTLENAFVRSIETFDIERVDVDVASRLIQPVEFTPAEFIEYYEAGQLQYEFSTDEQHELGSEERDQDQTPTTEASSPCRWQMAPQSTRPMATSSRLGRRRLSLDLQMQFRTRSH